MPTLIKLLLIRMVANNLFGFCNRRKINLSVGWLLSRSVSRSAGCKEKKAVSAPETNPEEIKRKTSNNNEKMSPVEIPTKNCSANKLRMLGKGSKSEISTKVYLVQMLAAKLTEKLIAYQILLKWKVVCR